VSVQERRSARNRAHADLVLSLHFDGAPGPAVRGATAYCPPATSAAPRNRPGAGPAGELLPWRDVPTARREQPAAGRGRAVVARAARLGPHGCASCCPTRCSGVTAGTHARVRHAHVRGTIARGSWRRRGWPTWPCHRGRHRRLREGGMKARRARDRGSGARRRASVARAALARCSTGRRSRRPSRTDTLADRPQAVPAVLRVANGAGW